jgi:hypothetical protein
MRLAIFGAFCVGMMLAALVTQCANKYRAIAEAQRDQITHCAKRDRLLPLVTPASMIPTEPHP